MASKKTSSRKRSRPVEKKSKLDTFKKNKLVLGVVLIVVAMVAIAGVYLTTNNTDEGDNTVTYDTDYPVAEISTSKGLIAIELYTDKAPKTCENFINLVNDGFYDGLIFHRVMDDFMIQAGNTMPDGSTKNSPYGKIGAFEGSLTHEDGVISMASTGLGISGEAQFFIMDGSRVGPEYQMDGNYAAFGKTIYGIEVVRDIADESHDGSYGAVGGGRPTNGDIIINSITIENQ